MIGALHKRYPQTIVGVKDSGCQIDVSRAFAKALMPRLQVWVGNELDMQAMALLGTAGAVSGVANLMPRLVGRLISDAGSARAPDELVRVRSLLDMLTPLGLIPAFKAALAGLDDDPGWLRVRPPLVALDAAGAAQLGMQLGSVGIDRSLD